MGTKSIKLDTLHYTLMGVILLLGAVLLASIWRTSPKKKRQQNFDFVLAKYQADSLFVEQEYDAALAQYRAIDTKYKGRINLMAIEAMIANRRQATSNEASTPARSNPTSNNELQTRSDQGVADLNEMAQQKNKTVLAGTNVNDAGFRSVNEIVKGVLHITNADGAKIDYIGEVNEGKANGFGFAVFEKRGFYEGEWTNNMRHGEGTYYWQSGDSYSGQYEADHRSGFGVYTFATGEVFKGQWVDDLRSGHGVLTNKRGKILYEGEWVNNEPVRKKKRKK